MKYGFEREHFVVDKEGQVILAPLELPHDDCGWLAEARGNPSSNPIDAAYSLFSKEHQLKYIAETKGVNLKTSDLEKVPTEIQRTARRTFTKGLEKYNNMYGKEHPRSSMARAGLHVHFSDYEEYTDKNGYVRRSHRIMNMPKIISKLDEVFKQEIKAAKRAPGMYELKEHGFEYRSLPATIDVLKVAQVLKNSLKNI